MRCLPAGIPLFFQRLPLLGDIIRAAIQWAMRLSAEDVAEVMALVGLP